jgi:hypothetical protein
VLQSMASALPTALAHSPAAGPALLASRLDLLLGRVVGDLRIDQGLIIHERTGAEYHASLAVRLVLAYPHAVSCEVHSDVVAMCRFRRWLAAQGSTVRVTSSRGMHRYQLVVAVQAAA